MNPYRESTQSNIILGQNIGVRRRSLGYSRVKLAQLMDQAGMVGCDHSWVRRIEEGQDPSPDELFFLRDALKINDAEKLLQQDAFIR